VARPDRINVLTGNDLHEAVAAIAQWEVAGDRLRRTFTFADFSEAFGFMARVALLAEKIDHHPNWSNVWNRVDIEVTNHEAGGITAVDVHFAGEIDRLAAPD
jgi:4a-hydroxytetrahydrobiopterin dehydratase